jgi:hypothetical protein
MGRRNLRPQRRRNGGFAPETDRDDRLPLASAVPLWGAFAMLGWLTIGFAAVYLARILDFFR